MITTLPDGVAVGVGVLVGVPGIDVLVGVGVFVGEDGVFVGVAVGTAVFVGSGVNVGVAPGAGVRVVLAQNTSVRPGLTKSCPSSTQGWRARFLAVSFGSIHSSQVAAVNKIKIAPRIRRLILEK